MPPSDTSYPHGRVDMPVQVFTLGRFLLQVNGEPLRFGCKAPEVHNMLCAWRGRR